MRTTKKTTSEKKIDVRIILSSLWVVRMLCSLQGDSTRFHDPVALNKLISGASGIEITNTMLLALSFLMAIPILMSFLSLIMKAKWNRWVNIGVGAFFVLFEIFFIVNSIGDAAYEIFWAVGYLASAILVVGYAWKWQVQTNFTKE